jgi:probable phosphoglycerate mutase
MTAPRHIVPAMEILLIRHGETESNAARIVQVPETPLSDRGIEQARHLARRLGKLSIGSIIASDLRRAVMTAACIHDATAAPLALQPLLQERNFGDIRGRPYSDLEVDIFDPDYAPPGGENWESFHARVDDAWSALCNVAREVERAGSGNLAVVTHGLVLHSLVTRHLSGNSDTRAFANTSVTTVAATPPYRILRLNCTEHLPESPRGAGAV